MAMLLVDRHVLVATRSDMIAIGVRTVLGAYDIKTECCRTLSACIPHTVNMIFVPGLGCLPMSEPVGSQMGTGGIPIADGYSSAIDSRISCKMC